MQLLPSKVTRAARSSSQGFSLMEVVLAVSIMSVIAGVSLPVTLTVLDRANTKATKQELQNLADAASRMFEDTKTLPLAVEHLLIDQGTPGWTGPYLPGSFVDGISGLGGYEVDGWSNGYVLRVQGAALTFTSKGGDGTLDSDDDIALTLDTTMILRRETLENLEVINAALQSYNSLHLAEFPLPANFASIQSTLVSTGFLPDSVLYQKDAWGDSYVEDPLGSTPVVRIKSIHIATDSTSAPMAGGEGGAGWGGW